MTLESTSHEFRARRDRFRVALRERDLAGAIVWGSGTSARDHAADVLYLTNWHCNAAGLPDGPFWTLHGHCAVVICVDGPDVLLSTVMDDFESRARIEDARWADHLPQRLAEVLQELGLAEGRLGLVAPDMPHRAFAGLEAALGRRLAVEDVEDILHAHRLVKSAGEIEMLRGAAAAGGRWLTAMMEAAQPGRTHSEIAADGIRAFTAAGGTVYDIGMDSGPDGHRLWGTTATTHWSPQRRVQAGDLFHADCWGPVDGYWTDFARSTVVGGRPSSPQREILEASVAFIDGMVDQMRPGVTVGDIHAHGIAWLRQHGLLAAGEGAAGEANTHFQEFFPSFGHSIGLNLEAPYVAADDPTVLAPNMVICIEGPIVRPGVGAAYFERMVLVTDDGPDRLDDGCPARWWN